MSLKQKAISGFVWTFAQQFSVQLLSFVISIILARILLPKDFGLIALLSLFMGIGNCLMDGGLTSSLIRTENPTQADLSTIFFLNLMGSTFVYALLFFIAPYISEFYNQPLLTLIIRVYCTTILINALNSVQATLLTKEMRFKAQTAIQLPSLIIGGIVGIILAYNNFGVWSLVWMAIVQAFFNCLLHWLRSNWRPKALFDKDKFKYHFKFGYKLTLSGLLDTIFENLYGIIIGRFYAPAQLAFYNRANAIQMLPVQNISTALNKVSFPMFSMIKDDDEQLRKAYKMLLMQIIFWIVPLMLILNLCSESVIRILLTDKWIDSVPIMKVLCFYGMLYPLHVYNLNVLLVKGRSDLFLRLEIAKKTLFVVGLFFAFKQGILALAWWQVIFSIGAVYINTYYSGKLINYSFFKQVKDILPSFIVGFILFFGARYLTTTSLYNGQSLIIKIISMTTAFMATYLLISFLIKNQAFKDCISILNKRKLL